MSLGTGIIKYKMYYILLSSYLCKICFFQQEIMSTRVLTEKDTDML